MKFQKILEILELTCYPETHQLGWKMILENEKEIIKSLRRNKNVKLVEMYRQDLACGGWKIRFSVEFFNNTFIFCTYDDDFLPGAIVNEDIKHNIETIKEWRTNLTLNNLLSS